MSGGEKPKIEACPMAREQTREAARLHTRELPHEFLTRFGPEFLSRYYRAFVDSPHATALVARLAGRDSVEGVLIGTFDTRAHYSYLVRNHGLKLALSTLRQMLLRPRLAGDILRTRLLRYARGIFRSLRYEGKESKKSPPKERVGFAAYVAVDAHRRGCGMGARLFEAYEEQAREAGLQRLELVTLPDERGAAPFFDGLGWKREGEITSRSGERYALFAKDLKG